MERRPAGPVVLGDVGPLPAAAIASIHADPPDPMPVAEHAVLLTDLPPAAVDALLVVAGPESGASLVVVELRRLGGAVRRGDGLLQGLDAAFTLNTIGIAVGPAATATAASAAAVAGVVAPWDTGTGLPDFCAMVDPAQVLRISDAATLRRLGALIDALDPDHVIAGAEPVLAASALAEA